MSKEKHGFHDFCDFEELHNLTPVSFGHYYAFVPDDFDEELKDDIKVAFAKRFIGLKSLDYTKNKYFPITGKQEVKDPYMLLLEKITNSIWELNTENYNRLDQINLVEKNDLTLRIISNLKRLHNSYESAMFLIKRYFFFESISLVRIIFEQLNYCYKLSNINVNNDINWESKSVRNKLSSTDINELKKVFPEGKIGRLYSYLSEYTHIDSKVVNRYVSYDSDKDDHLITTRSILQAIEGSLTFLNVTGVHSVILECSLHKFSDIELKNITCTNGVLSINQMRKSIELFEEYYNEFEHLLNNVEILPKMKSSDDEQYKDLPF